MRAQKRAAAADAERAPAPRRVTGSAAGILHHATAAQIVVRHTGPVLVVDADGAILAHNAEAAPLVGAISAIADLIEQARGGAPTAAKVEIAGAAGVLSLELSGLPLASPPSPVLVSIVTLRSSTT